MADQLNSNNIPIPVTNGGTGVNSVTAYAVICGGTTATGGVQSIASVGTANQVLTSNGAGALPTMQDYVADQIQAWGTFTPGGTQAIGDSFNITSVTQNSTGNYTVNFTSNLANANYAVALSADWPVSTGGSGTDGYEMEYRNQAVGSVDVLTFAYTGASNATAAFDSADVSIVCASQ